MRGFFIFADMIVIREATREDIAEMREVAISTYQDTFAEFNTPENMKTYLDESYSMHVLVEELHEMNAKLFLACDEDKIIGFARLRKNPEVSELLGDHTIEVQRLYVLTEAQGKSAGRLLMETSMKYASEKKYNWIWLGVWEKNFKAQEFYKKNGFEKFSEHTFWMGDDPQVDWLLKKRLQ